jgi:glyoxylate reductase
MLMAVARRILEGDRLVRSGVFPGPHSMFLLGSGVYGKSIGIVGMGKEKMKYHTFPLKGERT